jgi:hypothetical protein
MKKISLAAATLGIAALASGAANAAGGSATGSFDVTVKLTPICQIASTTTFGASDTLSNMTLDYTSFNSSDVTKTTSFNVRCAAGLSYSVKLDTDTVTTLGLNYTLGLADGSGSPAYTGGATGLSGETGAVAGKSYQVGAKIAAGQGGDCGSSSNAVCSNTAGRTVTITY